MYFTDFPLQKTLVLGQFKHAESNSGKGHAHPSLFIGEK